SIRDARARLLKPGGVLIPTRDTVYAGVVSATSLHDRIAPSLDPSWGLDLRPAWKSCSNEPFNRTFTEEQYLTKPECLMAIDYSSVNNPDFKSKVEFQISRTGAGHGLGLWFERALAEGVCFSTGPGHPRMVYGGLFLPWPEPVELAGDDAIAL